MMASRTFRVLLIDDDEQIRRVYTRAFSAAGYDVDAVGNAVDALERARSWRPDLALVDLRLPAITGDELASVLRVHPETREAILVAFSGYVGEEDLGQLREGGFDAVLPKTLSAQSIIARVGQLLARDGPDPLDPAGTAVNEHTHEVLHALPFANGRAARAVIETIREALADPTIHAQTPAGPLVIYGPRALGGVEPVLLWATSGILQAAKLIEVALPEPVGAVADASRLPYDTLVLFAALGGTEP